MFAGIFPTPFSPSNIREVLCAHSGHNTCDFCTLAHFVIQPSQYVWPHSSSRGIRLPIGLETSESTEVTKINFTLLAMKQCVTFYARLHSWCFPQEVQLESLPLDKYFATDTLPQDWEFSLLAIL